jgi:hypothetical protein
MSPPQLPYHTTTTTSSCPTAGTYHRVGTNPNSQTPPRTRNPRSNHPTTTSTRQVATTPTPPRSDTTKTRAALRPWSPIVSSQSNGARASSSPRVAQAWIGQKRWMRWHYRVSTLYLVTPHHQPCPLLLPGTHHSPLHRTTHPPRPTTYLPTCGTTPQIPNINPDAPHTRPAPRRYPRFKMHHVM